MTCVKCGKERTSDDSDYSYLLREYIHKECMTEEDLLDKFEIPYTIVCTKHGYYDNGQLTGLAIGEYENDENETSIIAELWRLLISKGVRRYHSNYVPIKITVEFLDKKD